MAFLPLAYFHALGQDCLEKNLGCLGENQLLPQLLVSLGGRIHPEPALAATLELFKPLRSQPGKQTAAITGSCCWERQHSVNKLHLGN